MPGVLTGRPREDREETTGRRHVTTEADGGEAATRQQTPRPPAAARVGVGGLEHDLPGAFRRTNLAETLISGSDLQNCDRINGCCFKPLSLW